MVRVRVRVGKVRKPYPNFQMVLLSMILSDLWPTFQGHDNIQCPVTRLTVSRAWSVQWFHFQWLWVALNVDFKVTGDALDELCAQLTRDLFAIAKFLFGVRCILPYYCGLLTLFSSAHFCMDELDLQWPSIWCYCHSVWCLINIISFFYCHFMFAAFCRCRMIVFFGYFVVNCSVCCESWTRYQSSWQWSNVTRKLRRWCDTTVRTALRTFRANCHWRSESTGRFNVWTACFNLKGYSGQKCELS